MPREGCKMTQHCWPRVLTICPAHGLVAKWLKAENWCQGNWGQTTTSFSRNRVSFASIQPTVQQRQSYWTCGQVSWLCEYQTKRISSSRPVCSRSRKNCPLQVSLALQSLIMWVTLSSTHIFKQKITSSTHDGMSVFLSFNRMLSRDSICSRWKWPAKVTWLSSLPNCVGHLRLCKFSFHWPLNSPRAQNG